MAYQYLLFINTGLFLCRFLTKMLYVVLICSVRATWAVHLIALNFRFSGNSQFNTDYNKGLTNAIHLAFPLLISCNS